MKKLWSILVINTVLLAAIAPTIALGGTKRLVSPAVFARVMKVHHCEEPSSWHTNGSLYQGGLGWRPATWAKYRLVSFPANAARATPQEQAYAMLRFVTFTLHYWPDQNYPAYCGGGY